MVTKMEQCERCNGKGHIKAYGHVMDGVCFKCGGSGKQEAKKVRKPSAKQLAAKAAKEARREADAQEYNRKLTEVVKRYTGDPRIRVAQDHDWYKQHCIQWAQFDGVWDTL